MSIKLLFLIVISLLLSSCYTRYVYIYTDEPVDEVYIYDVNYVYSNLWYDDFYWRYNTNYYDNYCYFGLNYYTPEYWAYSNYYKYKPYHKRHHRQRPRFQSRHTTRRLVGHLRGQNDPIGRGKARYNRNDRSKLEQKHGQGVQVKPQKQRKFNNRTKKSDQVVTKRKWNNNRSGNKTKIHRSPTRNNSPKTKIRQSPPRNSSPKKSAPRRSTSKRSTKKGRK